MEEDSLIVHGLVTEVTYDREDLIEDIVDRTMRGTGMTITLNVIKQYPETHERESITYRQGASWEYTSFVLPDHQYVFAFREIDGELEGGGVTTTFHIRNGAVDRVVNHAPLELQEMWALVRTWSTEVESRGGISVHEWRTKLDGDNLSAALAALEVLSAQPDTIPEPGVLVDVLERHLPTVTAAKDDYQQRQTFSTLEVMAPKLLIEAADPIATARMYDLYVHNIAGQPSPALQLDYEDEALITALAGSTPSPERIERLSLLFTGEGDVWHERGSSHFELLRMKGYAIGGLADTPGKEIDQFLLDMAEDPGKFGLKSELCLSAVWQTLGQRGVAVIQPTLLRIAEDPGSFNAGVPPLSPDRAEESRKSSALEALAELSLHLPREEALALLLKIDSLGYYDTVTRMLQVGDRDLALLGPSLREIGISKVIRYLEPEETVSVFGAPAVLEASNEELTPAHLRALIAAGLIEEASQAALEALANPLETDGDLALYGDIQNCRECAAVVAFRGPPAAADLLERLLSPKERKARRQLADEEWSTTDVPQRYHGIETYEAWLLAALFRLAPAAARPFLMDELADTNEERRLFAAWALYAMGEDAGEEIVIPYARRETDYTGEVSLLIAHSLRTDALMLERLGAGFNTSDSNLFRQNWYREPCYSDFIADHEDALLNLLVRHLETGDSKTRSSAFFFLTKHLTSEAENLPDTEVERAAAIKAIEALVAQRWGNGGVSRNDS
jgi:hypothetical protein